MTGKNFVKDPGIHQTLVADGFSIIFDGSVVGLVNTTYDENTSAVVVTRITSVWVTTVLVAFFAIELSFISSFLQLLQMSPSPLIGGISMIMFGLIYTNGIWLLINNKIDYTNMKNVFVTVIILLLDLGWAVFIFNLGTDNLQFTVVALAAFSVNFIKFIVTRSSK